MAGKETVVIALDVGINMGDRGCPDPQRLDKNHNAIDLAVATAVMLINRKVITGRFHPLHPPDSRSPYHPADDVQ